MDSYRQYRKSTNERQGSRAEELGYIYRLSLEQWKFPEYAPVMDEIKAYISNRYSGLSLTPILGVATSHDEKYVGITEARNITGLGRGLLFRAAKDGTLKQVKKHNNALMVAKSELEMIRNQYEEAITKQDAMAMLGVSAPLFDVLVDCNLVQPLITHPILDKIANKKLFSRSRIEQFLNTIFVHAEAISEVNKLTLLKFAEEKVIGAVTKLGMDASDLLQMVINDRIQGYCKQDVGEDSQRNLQNLYVDLDEVNQVAESIEIERDWIMLSDACDILNTTTPTLRQFIDAGILNIQHERDNYVCYISRSEVMQFRAKYVQGVAVAAKYLEIDPSTFTKYVKRGILQRVFPEPDVKRSKIQLFEIRHLDEIKNSLPIRRQR